MSASFHLLRFPSPRRGRKSCEKGKEFFAIGADGKPISPVREANPTHREEAKSPALLPSVDQTDRKYSQN